MVEVTQNGILTLHTTGKVCREDIKVNVNVEGGGGVDHIETFVQGTTEGEYYSENVTSLRYGAFADCSQITKIDLPNCTNVGGNYAFFGMTNVKEILLPNVTSGVFGGTFYACSNVETIDLRNLGGVLIDSNCFRNCSKLKTLILGGTEETGINTLANTTVFNGTPSTMSIYVPDNSVNAYKSATNWSSSNIASRIKSRKDYPGGPI